MHMQNTHLKQEISLEIPLFIAADDILTVLHNNGVDFCRTDSTGSNILHTMIIAVHLQDNNSAELGNK